MKKLLVVLSLAALAGATYAKADNIQTLPSYAGVFNVFYPDPGPYQPPYLVGMFNILAGGHIDRSLGNVWDGGHAGDFVIAGRESVSGNGLGSVRDPGGAVRGVCALLREHYRTGNALDV